MKTTRQFLIAALLTSLRPVRGFVQSSTAKATICLPSGRRLQALLVFLLLVLSSSAQAQFNYTTDNGQITITGYTGSGGAVTIPSSINGLPVTIVGNQAFRENHSLTRMTIPNSVTTIGDFAFQSCTSLAWASIGNSVTSIGRGAFSACTSLTVVTIPDSVTSLGEEAFSNCENLSSVTIGDRVTSLGQYTFHGCTSLTGITIPNSVTSLGSYVFQGCTRLSAITVDPPNSSYRSENGVLFNNSLTLLLQCPGGKAGRYSIPNTVTRIEERAFQSCTSLVDVTIGNGATIIGNQAFRECTSLTNITIGNSVTSIGSYALSGCIGLTNITIPKSVSNIGEFAFGGCTRLIEIMVDALNPSFSSVDGVLFDKGQALLLQYPWGKAGDYTIPSSVRSIGAYAFGFCPSLTGVTIPDSVASIELEAFTECTSLTSVTIPNSVTRIEEGAFRGCTGLAEVTIGNGVTRIERFTFSDCTSLTNVVIGNSVTRIGEVAFSYCKSLASVTIPGSVTFISKGGVAGCTSLTGAYFTGNAPGFDWGAFWGSDQAIFYHLPGTTGWEPTASTGNPTALWLPRMQTSDASFGLRENQFGFNIAWARDRIVVVEAGVDLANPVWTPVGTNTLTGGTSYFSDPHWTNHPIRLYRLRAP